MLNTGATISVITGNGSKLGTRVARSKSYIAIKEILNVPERKLCFHTSSAVIKLNRWFKDYFEENCKFV